MDSATYEQFVRAVLVDRLGIPADKIRSSRERGVALPGLKPPTHQIDLLYVHEDEVSKSITIVECKYRESRKVDQKLVENLATVKKSVRASKAILATNTGFTSGAESVADAERIALLVIEPRIEAAPPSTPSAADQFDELLKMVQEKKKSSYDMKIVRKFHGEPGDSAGFLAELLEDERVQHIARDVVRNHPDIGRIASDFLRRGGF